MAETVLPALGAFVSPTLQPGKNKNIAENHGKDFRAAIQKTKIV